MPLAEHGLTIPAGCGPTVGISGLTLGGGLGILGRSHGLTSDSLLSARVVLADGRLLHCHPHQHGDLFWALRGAGGRSLAVVTRLSFRTLPSPPATAFELTWPSPRAAALIRAWQAWSPDAPDHLAASLLLVVPEIVDTPPAVHLLGAALTRRGEAEELLTPLIDRVGEEPSVSVLKELPYREVKRYLAANAPGDQRPDGHAYIKSEFFAQQLPADVVGGLVDHFCSNRANGTSRELDFTPWGGAYNRVPADATAFVHRTARFLRRVLRARGQDDPIPQVAL
jgi:FAD/FMN-containing dehydrogenase